MQTDDVTPYVGEIVLIEWLDHFGVKQDWNEDFPVKLATARSVGWLSAMENQAALLTPHRVESPHDREEGSCGDMVLAISAIISVQPLTPYK